MESLNSLKICAGSELCSIQNVTQLIEAQQVGLPGWRLTAASEALGGGWWHAQACRVDAKCLICSLLWPCVACREHDWRLCANVPKSPLASQVHARRVEGALIVGASSRCHEFLRGSTEVNFEC